MTAPPTPPAPGFGDVTLLLARLGNADESAARELYPLVYDELRAIAARCFRDQHAHTLQPTALVHEVFLQLVEHGRIGWKGRAHFFGVASQLMRRILVDHARARLADKRGGDVARIPLDAELQISVEREADVLAVDEAVQKLAALHPRHADIVVMRFFGGMSVEEVAAVLGEPKRTVEAHWTFIRSWLRRELTES